MPNTGNGYTKLETPVPARTLQLGPRLALGWVNIQVLKWMLKIKIKNNDELLSVPDGVGVPLPQAGDRYGHLPPPSSRQLTATHLHTQHCLLIVELV